MATSLLDPTVESPLISGQQVRLEHLSKSFGSRTVLRDAGFEMPPGKVVALLGQNGSGKSTLIKLLAGYHEPDEGTDAAVVIGEERASLPLRDGADFRFAFVHQDLALLPTASVAENLLIDRLGARALGRLSWRKVRARAQSMLDRVGATDISPSDVTGRLQPVERAMVAIARAMDELIGGGLLILDEVTAFLTQDGIDQLFELIRQVAQRGIGVLFVSHRLEEIWRICDRAVVLRNGEVVKDVDLAETCLDDLVSAIVGEQLDWLYPEKHAPGEERRVRFREVQAGRVRSFSLEANAGEIIGLTGLRGMGHERIIYALYGEAPERRGTVEINGGVEVALGSLKPSQAFRMGMRLVPSDRLENGAVGGATVRENASLPLLDQFVRRLVLRRTDEREWATNLIESYGVSPADCEAIYSSLSGGNQQKVLVARWLETRPTVLLLDEPAQGVDIGSRRDIFARIVDAAKRGITVLYSSSEVQDLAELCHRVLVFRDGAVVGQLSGSDVTEGAISRMCWAGGDGNRPTRPVRRRDAVGAAMDG
ncbi:MAG: sugar ABC transporter ATP-binding protein [Acidimicrobiaceae bacterium]|nr:sugar ABC transporter ATP-binding protein [Acidimicrobiaceae bacterium]